MKTKQVFPDSYKEETSKSNIDSNEDEVEKDFSEIDSFNRAISHLKETFFGKDKKEITDQIEKA